MRVVQKMFFVVLMSSLMAAQSAQSSGTDTPKGDADVQKLLDAVTAQQKAIAEQQKQIQEQQLEIERLKAQFAAAQAQPVSTSSDAQSGKMVNASLTAPNTNAAARTVSDVAQDTERPKESPLSFRIGGAEFTPGGFMDFTSIFRSTNTGNPGGTNFFAIPFSNTVAGHLTENRFTAQNSRLSLKATSKFGENDVAGYVEVDFLGNDAANVFVTSNSHTLRQRLYFVDLKRHNWEIAAGQLWSWLTPNRVGVSPYTSDVFYSQDMDFNYQVGLTWARQPGVHIAYHPNDHWVLGIGLEDPEQFGGQGEITFPTTFNAQLAGQIDQANISSTPNLHPDIIPKIAYDTDVAGKHFHVEAAGLLTGLKVTDLSNGVFVKHTKEGAGLEAAVNLELAKGFRFVSNAFWSDGGGRYDFGMGPDLVVLPNAAANDVFISLVHSFSGIAGFEAQVTPHTQFYGYYGGDYFQRNFGTDFTAAANGAGFRPNIGFGFPQVLNGLGVAQFGGSANNNNRAVQEGSLGWIQTFWKNPQYGAFQLITQASYLTRAPWFVAAGAPKNAHLAMGWVDLRYVLP